MARCRQGAVRPGRGVVTGLRLPGVARRRRCVAPARSVVFRRVEGRVFDPRSRARQLDRRRWTRTATVWVDGIVLESISASEFI